MLGHDSLKTRRTLRVGGKSFETFSLAAAEEAGLGDVSRLPRCLKVLLENLLRHEDGRSVTVAEIRALAAWSADRRGGGEIAFHPARVLMHDVSGLPLLADLAAMRDTMAKLGGDPSRINPRIPIDFVIDHSGAVDYHGRADALKQNTAMEFARNGERFGFFRWSQGAFRNIRLLPPGKGICHQVNLEFLARVVWWAEEGGAEVAFPDSLLGMDSHTPMINGLGVLGMGAGGIEAGAAMLGQPVSMLIPEVVGCRLLGRLRPGVTATDAVLTLTQRLREHGVIQKLVEFCGPGLESLSLPERATLANMAPEYGATTGFFPVDRVTVEYLALTGREPAHLALVEAYTKAQGMWHDPALPEPLFTEVVEFDLGRIEPSLAGPHRPQDRVPLSQVPAVVAKAVGQAGPQGGTAARAPGAAQGAAATRAGDVVLAAITSCTNTSNPAAMLGAGLLARNAVARGLAVKPTVKTSLSPGSQVVGDYLAAAGLQGALDQLGFMLAGFGCMTCMGNSGPLVPEVARNIEEQDLVVAAVLSGNRNFEGRVHPQCRINFLASPPLVVAYALAGTTRLDLEREPLGHDREARPVYLRDIWPDPQELRDLERRAVTPRLYRDRYARAEQGDPEWEARPAGGGTTFDWPRGSTYLLRPPFFEGLARTAPPVRDILGARPLAMLGDSITTDHISPVGNIEREGLAGKYLSARGVEPWQFNSFGARRANHEVMMRGTFSNIRLKNELVPGTEGGVTRYLPEGGVMPIYDAAMRYLAAGVPLVVIAGREYGIGSARDWAAKGPRLLGVRAVIAESLERIHRSNLIGMGVLPLQFPAGVTRKSLGLDGTETFDVLGLEGDCTPGMALTLRIHRADGRAQDVAVRCRLDTSLEVDYYRHGGILHYVLRDLLPHARA
ncbi:MAG: aconitate hydratase AcnA [Candidatus Lambdaproteobacteria bacterium]|nr:aconitate hydratase AcnA [Candidatus Lambdaproteobacteria bacterium]